MVVEAVVALAFTSINVIVKLVKFIQDQDDRSKDVLAKCKELMSLLIPLNKINGDVDWAENVDRNLQLRLGQLRDTVYDAQDLLYPYRMGLNRPDIKNLETVLDRLKNIAEKDFSKLPNHPPVASSSRWTEPIHPAPQLFGRYKEKKLLLKLVGTDEDGKSKSNFKVIAIVGMGGSGKTALAQHVFDDVSIKKRFDLMVWVCGTHSHNVDLTSRTTKKVLRKLYPTSPNRASLDSSINDLGGVLKKKRFMIVLDDVWNLTPLQWQNLCVPFQSARKGSRFILTTRNPGLVRRLREKELVTLEEIQESRYLALFKQRAFRGANTSEYPKLVSIGTEIANRLNGSPLAAQTVGDELSSKLDVNHWKSVRDSRLCDIKHGEDGIIPSLRLTYMHLPAELKQCFAFGALFPPNYVFKRHDLVSMWKAQGFLQSSNKNVEDTGMDYFKKLLDISFFQPVEQDNKNLYVIKKQDINKNLYVINALLHEVAWSISNTEYCVIKSNKPEVRIPDKVRHLCVVGNTLPKVCKDINKMERLRSLVLLGDFNFDNDDKKMFGKLKSLRLRLLIILGCKDKFLSTIKANSVHLLRTIKDHLLSTIKDNSEHLPHHDISSRRHRTLSHEHRRA